MGLVRLTVGGRPYEIACRDGGEPRLEMLAQMVDARLAEAVRAVGRGSEGRELLLTALLLADTLEETRTRLDGHRFDTETAVAEVREAGEEARIAADAAALAVEQLAGDIEALADGLEKAVATS
jgi:cell division protein ZapA